MSSHLGSGMMVAAIHIQALSWQSLASGVRFQQNQFWQGDADYAQDQGFNRHTLRFLLFKPFSCFYTYICTYNLWYKDYWEIHTASHRTDVVLRPEHDGWVGLRLN